MTAAVDPGDQVRVLLRYDDYTRDSSVPLEQKLLGELHQLGVPLLVGVVPFLYESYPAQTAVSEPMGTNLGQDKIARLRELLPAGRVEVALHGYSHRANAVIDYRDSEFAGLGLERQRQLLALGRSSLEHAFGVPVRVFTPPFNAFDDTTLSAMEQAGFEALSAGLVAPGKQSSLAYVPGTVYPQKMRGAIETALKHNSGSKLVVVVMHPYDFVESDDPVPPFRKLRDKISVNQVLEDIRWASAQPGVKFVSFSGEVADRSDLSAARLEANANLRGSWVRAHMLLPGPLASPTLDGALLSTATAREIYWKENMLALFVFAAMGLGGFAFSSWLNKSPAIGQRRGAQKKWLAGLLPTLIGFSVFQGFYFTKAVLLALGLGWYAGVRPR